LRAAAKVSAHRPESWNFYLPVFPNRIAPILRIDLDGVRAARFAPEAAFRRPPANRGQGLI